MASFEEYLCLKFEKDFNLQIRGKMSVFGNQNYKKVEQLALRAEKLTNERVVKGKFQKKKGFGFMSGQSSKKSKSFESLGNSSGSGADLVSSPKHSDLRNHPDLARRHLVPLLGVEPYQKDVLVVVNFILGLAMLFKCVFNVDRQITSRSSIRCLILLHQWGNPRGN